MNLHISAAKPVWFSKDRHWVRKIGGAFVFVRVLFVWHCGGGYLTNSHFHFKTFFCLMPREISFWNMCIIIIEFTHGEMNTEHKELIWCNWTQFPKVCFNILFPSKTKFSAWSFPFRRSYKSCCRFSSPHACYILGPSHPLRFGDSNNIWRSTEIEASHIADFPASCHFVSHRARCFQPSVAQRVRQIS